MFGLKVNSQPKWVQVQAQAHSQSQSRSFIFGSRNGPTLKFDKTRNHFSFPSFCHHSPQQNQKTQFSVRASSASVGSTEFIEEPATKVSFQRTLNLPGCSSPLSLLGTGVREKIFAIIGVKVYAAALYANPSVFTKLDSDIQGDSSLFKSFFQAPLEKSLQIVLVRDIDGKTFWDALDEAVSPRIKSPTLLDESALSTFRSIFRGKSLKKGTFIFLTWLDSSKMLISVSSNGIPSTAGTTIESENVASSLFDVFFGDSPVSPSLKASVASALATSLN